MENFLEWIRTNMVMYGIGILSAIILWIIVLRLYLNFKIKARKRKNFSNKVANDKNFDNLAPEINNVPNFEEQPKAIVQEQRDWAEKLKSFNDVQDNVDFEDSIDESFPKE